MSALRKTLGFDFNFEQFDSDEESEAAGAASRTAPVPVPGRLSAVDLPLPAQDDVDRLDSMGQSADQFMADYLQEMSRSPPRTSTRRHEKRAYRYQAQTATRNLKANLKRRSSLEKFLSLPINDKEQDGNVSEEESCSRKLSDGWMFKLSPIESDMLPETSEQSRREYRRRQRIQQLERRTRRSNKQTTAGEFRFVVEEPHSSVPAGYGAEEHCSSVKVESSSCFLSLSSRPVAASVEAEGSCSVTPRPSPRRVAPGSASLRQCSLASSEDGDVTSCADPERRQFHHMLSTVVQLGSTEPRAPDSRRRSCEDQRYLNELQDVLWLALQAYHQGESMRSMDGLLCQRRAQLPGIVDQLLAFSFRPVAGELPGCVGAGSCLNVWCRSCLSAQRRALQQVAELVDRLDAAEQLYPSHRKLCKNQPRFQETDFRRRVKSLHLWYNLTSQLWLRMRIIRQYLKGMGAGHLPWPDLDQADAPIVSPPTARSSLADVNSVREKTLEDSCGAADTQRVRFELNVPPSIPSSNPSDSNSSADTGELQCSRGSASRMEALSSIRAPRQYHWSVSAASSDSCDVDDSKTPYRKCVDKLLKTRGLKRTLAKLLSHLGSALDQTYVALLPADLAKEGGSPLHESHISSTGSSLGLDESTLVELRQYGEQSASFKQMNLPSFWPVYTWLNLVPLEVTHECVKIRLEQQPAEPSALSIRQLILECKEALKASVMVRQRFCRRMRAAYVSRASALGLARLDAVMETFDADIKELLEVYLRYIKRLLLMMQGEIEVSAAQKNLLEEEWTFAKSICPHIAGGEAIAGKHLCYLVSDILPSIGDLLENAIDSCTSTLQRSFSGPDDIETQNSRLSVLSALREFQSIIQEARDRALKVLLFARLLRRDLEVAAEFSVQCPRAQLLRRLASSGHIRVIAPHSHNHIIFIPGSISWDREYVWQLLDMTVCREDVRHIDHPGYLVLITCDNGAEIESCWTGTTMNLEPTAETTITLTYVEVEGLMVVVNHAGSLSRARHVFQLSMGECVIPVREQTTPNRSITDAMDELKDEAMKLKELVTSSITVVEEKCCSILGDSQGAPLLARCREVVQQCFKFAFEYHRELTRLITGGRWRGDLSCSMVALTRQWISHVIAHCPAGRGLRPRWTREGFEFISLCTEPTNTAFLTDLQFQELKSEITRSFSHVSTVGSCSRSGSPAPLSRTPYRTSRSLNSPRDDGDGRRSFSNAAGDSGQLRTNPPSPVTSPLDRSSGSVSPMRASMDNMSLLWPAERTRLAVLELEESRDAVLRDRQLIGRVSERHADRVHIKAKIVGFTWQMGFLIGQGRFGRVYTAVNNKSGELMAVKELALQPGDHRTLRAVSEELKILEGIQHRHLVRYYGVEIHREEMFIFMEFCGEGTLEGLSSSLDGLPEELIRRYTKQLLSAILCLHSQKIVHRDVKGANIFLTDECRCLKLGDFGCSVKIVAHTTMQGEVKGLVGTPAFMAPEVYTQIGGDEGQGRAADIWSLGCVVVEMATGKRPFPELDNSYQIMFRVGMGHCPCTPCVLSQEGAQFLQACFVHDPKKRALANQLLDHPFVKVEVEGDEFLGSLPHSLLASFLRSPG